ncbi:MAG: CDP-alcohol phosphatidyltransferase family protein [Ignavibacteriota bacterium]|jgi:CDP-diacylglycerol--glycerol-3-phosphate 3-phosphatidyltransferase|nr:MAG: CDP-alcohol phosphatidyltransferase family protein [Chlorobiota bacterium]MBE7478017.1 CDP-alcohol phosphatidyltransferase family protein [Ignavibacteriales bacterium]MBL1123452.1 CDP-alcohol phosphatidyltransferase family protein [Ignavibacteriota bacterium]MCC7094860.1 CDP-alcohol phosphatidyltransferase family protein [Ignavibacteriaceae bacterium]MCE7856601.1 CDP-alcohol phosphatidyltransferase family protein [Ignavibacteria bacterium CHB3]MEB2296155.1 CDP-alcohol phosphatidyltrans
MSRNKIFNASNSLSFLRLLLVIPAWIAFSNFDKTSRYTVAAIGIFAAITDILDGYLARKLNQITEFGKIIDPLADKVLVVFVVFNLFLIGDIPEYYFYLIVARDFLILIGGLIVSKKLGKVLPSDYLGKATVLAISFTLLMILLNVDRQSLPYLILYYLSILLIFISFINYVIKAIKSLNKMT